jgi:hypothetical protein
MIKHVRELMAQRPFVPFTIHTSDGRGVQVPTSDHIAVSGHFFVIVTHDDDRWDLIPALHITGVTVKSALASS